ncbi:Uncharacterized ferredoxin-like protein YfaE [Buchnera aphidicola (Eriosoma grossulariae)]|uniref:class I ribonucleotide reductase maintenance protein YfaE n=1 Tax=Buchnera aphidicola TaxID=9 RepID=UPI003464B7CF
MKKYSITIIGQNKKIISHNSKILLKILENYKIKINAQCRYGFCGACKVILIKGQIKYIITQPIAFAYPEEVFPCCCIMMSDIQIKI